MIEFKNLPGFVRLYVGAMGTSSIPTIYHVWLAFSVLAAFATNRLWIDMGDRDTPISPHLYTMLIGPPASGKGRAIRKMFKLVQDVEFFATEDEGQLGPPTYWGSTSGRGFMKIAKLARACEGSRFRDIWIIMPELADGIGQGGVAEGFVRSVTNLFDEYGNDTFAATKQDGLQKMDPLLVNWLSATTPEWLRGSISIEDFSGGFMSRLLPIWFSGRTPFYERTIYDPRADEMRDRILSHLAEIRRIAGTFSVTDEARKVQASWYRHIHEEEQTDDPIRNFKARASGTVWKLAALCSLGRNLSLEILPGDFVIAQRLYQSVCATLPSLLDILGEGEKTHGLVKFLQMVKARPGVPVQVVRAVLHRRYNVTESPFLEYEKTLINSGQIRKVCGANKRWVYEPTN